MQLDGASVIVTGASRGVGAAAAVALAARGARVVAAARSTDDAPQRIPGTVDETVRRITDAGGVSRAVSCDLSRDDDIERLVATTVDAFGTVDAIVNNAAVTFPGDEALAADRFDLVFAIDVRAPFLLVQHALGHLRAGSGSVCNVSSLAALNPFDGLMAYGMAKAALEHFTVALAARLRPDGVAVNGFRIDVPVASEGFLDHAAGVDTSDWEPPQVAAEGIVWMLAQPRSWTGHNLGMAAIRERFGIMASRTARAHHRDERLVTETHLRLPPPA